MHCIYFMRIVDIRLYSIEADFIYNEIKQLPTFRNLYINQAIFKYKLFKMELNIPLYFQLDNHLVYF